jgi:lipid-binding SYLF domain-containing protein
MRKWLSVLIAVLLVVSVGTTVAGEEDSKKMKAEEKRARIDKLAQETLDRLFKESKAAQKLYENAYGWAVFDNTKVAFLLTGGGGAGVAVEKGSGKRSYMKMGTAGIGVGIGAHAYQVVFLFENEPTFRQFVDKGWEAETQANAAAGTAGANAASSFTQGLAFYQLTEAGLIASADIAGTKYWVSKKLNK